MTRGEFKAAKRGVARSPTGGSLEKPEDTARAIPGAILLMIEAALGTSNVVLSALCFIVAFSGDVGGGSCFNFLASNTSMFHDLVGKASEIELRRCNAGFCIALEKRDTL